MKGLALEIWDGRYGLLPVHAIQLTPVHKAAIGLL